MFGFVYKAIYLKKRKDRKFTIVTNVNLEMFFLNCTASNILNLIVNGWSINDIICAYVIKCSQTDKTELTKICNEIVDLIIFMEHNYLIRPCW